MESSSTEIAPAAKKPRKSTVEVQGHRGFGSLEPHNTLKAFRAAAAHAGTTSVEFDVQLSADSHLVVTHGAEVGECSVPSQTLAQLQEPDLGGGERVPLLAEVVDVCLAGGLKLNVELKTADPVAIDATLELLRKKGALSSCRISSFHRAALQHVMKAAPDVPVGALYNPSTRPIDPEKPDAGNLAEPTPTDFASWFADHKVPGDSVNLRNETFTAEEIQEARKHGKQVMVWYPGVIQPKFADSAEEYRRVAAFGVDVICCNRPDILAEVLAESTHV